ncbi:MAG TPA: hypothetical protein DEQ17_06325 [Prevotella sp.]|nr:hypothetical protein [Prevotella sp.]
MKLFPRGIVAKPFRLCLAVLFSLVAASCNGLLSSVYDDADDSGKTEVAESQISMDASSWQNWYYISFDSLETLREQGDMERLKYAQSHFAPYPIPMAPTGDKTTSHPAQGTTGLYTYWYDIFGQGLSKNEFRAFTPTASQQEPEQWDIAIHYADARTNGGAVLKTSYTNIDDLPASSADFSGAEFTPDEWSESDVWADQTEQLNKLLGCQGIKINKVLSSWLQVEMKSLPPLFTLDSHVFLVKLKSGRYAAVQLRNYMDANGDKGHLTINYKYPY